MPEINEQNNNNGGTGEQPSGFSWNDQVNTSQSGMGAQPQPGMQSQIPLQGQYVPGGQEAQFIQTPPVPARKKSMAPLIISLSVAALLLIGGGITALILVFGNSLKAPFGVKEQSLELSETSVVELTVGEDYVLEIENFDELDKNQNIKWESADNNIITIKDKGDGTAKVTAVAAGKSSVFITGENLDKKKGYVIKFNVEEEAIEFAGKTWATNHLVYYFPDEDKLLGFYSFYDNYKYGPYTATEVEADYAYWEITDAVPGGRYFRVDFSPEREIDYGNEKSFCDDYEIWFGFDKKGDVYVYDDEIGYAEKAKEADIGDYLVSLPDDAAIQAYLDNQCVGAINYSSGYMILYGSIFDSNDAYHDNRRMVQCGDTIYVLCDDGLYSTPASALGSGKSNMTKVGLKDDRILLLASDGEKLAYAAGSDDADVDLYVYDPATGADSLILDGISLKHMAFCDDKIYYTEFWDSIKYTDLSGNTKTIWQNYVGAFWADQNFVYIYDGTNWDMLDIASGYTSSGYLCKGRSYECDRIYALEDNILTVGYDYNDNSISLHGIGFDGAEVTLGYTYYGDSSDTYSLACCGEYAYFYAYEGETIVCIEVTSGACSEVDLSTYGLWYANEMSVVDNRVVLHVYDSNGDDGYVEVDQYLNLTGIPELPHSINANSGSSAAYLFENN